MAAAEWAVRAFLQNVLPQHSPCFGFQFAAAVSAWSGWLGPGLPGMVPGGVTAAWWPSLPGFPRNAEQVFGPAGFLGLGLLSGVLLGRRQTGWRKLRHQVMKLFSPAHATLRGGEDRGPRLESLTGGFYAFDRYCRCTYVNQAAAALSARDRGQLLASTLWDVFPDRPETGLHRLFQRVLCGDPAGSCEFQVLARDRWLAARVYPAAEGGLIVLVDDVTARREADARARKRNELLLTAAAVAERLLTASGVEDAIRDTFEISRKLVGVDSFVYYRVEETGGALRLASSGGIPEPVVCALACVRPGEHVSGAVALHRRACVASHIQTAEDPQSSLLRSFGIRSFVCNPLLAGGRLLGTLGFASMTRDSFEADEVEFFRTVCHYVAICLERLELAGELKYRAELLELVPDAVVSLGMDGTILNWNKGAERMYGFTAAEAVGRAGHELWRTRFQQPREEIECTLAVTGSWQGELEHTRSDGTRIAVSSCRAIRNNAAGDAIEYLEVNRDITGQKRLEERWQRTANLESLGVLAGGMAHNFNNLLVGVLGNATLAMDGLPADHPDRALLRGVVTAAERAAGLIRQLLAYAGKSQFLTQTVDLTRLVRETGTPLHAAIPKHVRLRFVLDAALPSIQAGLPQLQEVVMNLVVNSAEAMQNRPGTVVVTTRAVDADEAYLRGLGAGDEVAPGTYAVLEVQDSGCGMDEATAARIFEPFFTTKFLGRGLGLAAVQGIVRSQRGALRVYTACGKGTAFKVLFPAAATAAATIERRPDAPLDDLRGSGTVLVVDDEDCVREAAAKVLTRLGYRAIAAADRRAAVELLRTFDGEVRAVLLDLTVPPLSGEDALTHMVAIAPGVPVIVSSGFNEGEALRRCYGMRFASFIEKPYTAQALARHVKAAIYGRCRAAAMPA
jgi:PAS domain S-box-containing protein